MKNISRYELNTDEYVFYRASKEYTTFEKSVPAPLFTKIFNVNNTNLNCELIIGCTGLYELYLNGKNITDGFLSPYISNSNDIVYFRSYNVDKLLKKGENRLSVLLGNGYANPIGGRIWNHDKRENRGAPAFALKLISKEVCFDASDMKWKPSCILFDDMRMGTYCDRRLDEKDTVAYRKPIEAESPTGEFRFVQCEPVREIRRLKPVEIFKGSIRNYRIRDCFDTIPDKCDIMTPAPLTEGYIYDFGENCAGVPVLNIKGKPGQKIHMQFSELMFEGFADYINCDVYPDGCCQQDIYICRGDAGGETYIPPFTYHGARYCYIHGIDSSQATAELLNFAVIRNDVSKTTEFCCTDEMLNEIYNACIRSDESNLVHIITDCPAREKNGWTGDVAISAEHYMTAFDAGKCFAEYMNCVRTAQGEDGSLPLFVPSPGKKDKCIVWDSALFTIPYYVYIYTGDTKIIEENADAMMKNLKFHLSALDERGIIENGLGDWLPVDSAADEYASPLGFCCSFTLCEMCKMGEIMFKRINMPEFAKFCADVRNSTIEAIRKEYCEGVYIGKGKTEKYIKATYRPCQTSQVLALYGGIFKEEEKQAAFDILVEQIEKNNNSFDCGFLGMRYIFHVLSKYGRSDLAYKMITKPTHPSYANMMIRGETTVWERFVKPGHRTGSHNHHFMADVSSWILKNIAGVKVNPLCDDPDTVLIDPCHIPEISEVNAVVKTPGGKVRIKLTNSDSGLSTDIKTEGKIKILYPEKSNY